MEEFDSWIDGIIQGGQLRAFIVAAVMVVAIAVISHVISRLLHRLLNADATPLPSSTILINIIRILIWAFGLSIMLSTCFNVDVNALVTALGVGGIALSLGLQDTIKNFFGGIQITFMRIVHPGDHIVVGSADGIVQDVSWRQTVVKDYENNVHLIPNSVMNSTEIIKVEPATIVVSTVVLNNDGRDIDALLAEMERLATDAVREVAPLQKDPWLLVTQIGEYGIWAKLRFILEEPSLAREARDAALRAIAPYTRNDSSDMLA